MSVRLARQVYGKSSVRLTKVTRRPERHELAELKIDIALEGDFSESYLTGDNRRVIPTDTMKNTVYALAASHPLDAAESFALALASHFVDRFAQVDAAVVTAQEANWERIATPQGPHRHSFVGSAAGQRTCSVRRTREGAAVEAGLCGLALLKTTDSAFRDFARDEFTTLKDADDRIFATSLDARWAYASDAVDWNAAFERARSALIATFAEHKSLAVQQTLFAMGSAVLDSCPEASRIELCMPNSHRVAVNLAPFGLPNRNEVFVATNEPFGLITAVLEREVQ